MAYVLYPTPEGKKCPIEKVESIPVTGADGATGVAVHFADGRVDYLVQSDRPGSQLKFSKFTSDAQVSYLRIEKGRVSSSQAFASEIRDLSDTPVRHKFSD